MIYQHIIENRIASSGFAFRRMRFTIIFCVAFTPLLVHSETSPPTSLTFSKPVPIHYAGSNRVYQTVLDELAVCFRLESASELKATHSPELIKGGILLSTVTDCTLFPDFVRDGHTNLHNLTPDRDACELFFADGCLVLLGNTPRGMLQAVYRLQEWAAEGLVLTEDLHHRDEFHFDYRIFHGRFGFGQWPPERADIRYISHLGATHCLVTHDWQGDLRHFFGYVSSPIFPEAHSASSSDSNREKLRRLIDDCLDYGLETSLWITELPCQGGPWMPESTRQDFLTHFDAEVLSDSGTYQGKVLCFSHPKVQAFYLDLMQRFFKEFPELSILFVFGIDANGEFCDPELCPRCKGLSKFAQRDRLLNFLIENGQKIRPGLRVLTTNWGWANINQDEFVERQIQLPKEAGVFMAAQYDGWQCERQDHDYLRRLREICDRNEQLFIGYDDLHWGDDSVFPLNDIQDFPLGIGAKLHRWMRLQADGVFDHWGTWPEDISCNSIACRDFFLNPLADPEATAQAIALRQFSPEAGEAVYAAWKALERAQAILSNACTWSPQQWSNWYQGRAILPTPDGFLHHWMSAGQFSTPAHGFTYNAGNQTAHMSAVGEAWRRAWPFYEKAIASLDRAITKADERPVFYHFWWNGEHPTPTCREHIQRQKIYVETTGRIGREIGLHLALNALYELTGGDETAYLERGAERLREHYQACLDAAQTMQALKDHGQDRDPNRTWNEDYRNKAEGIKTYLERNNIELR